MPKHASGPTPFTTAQKRPEAGWAPTPRVVGSGAHHINLAWAGPEGLEDVPIECVCVAAVHESRKPTTQF